MLQSMLSSREPRVQHVYNSFGVATDWLCTSRTCQEEAGLIPALPSFLVLAFGYHMKPKACHLLWRERCDWMPYNLQDLCHNLCLTRRSSSRASTVSCKNRWRSWHLTMCRTIHWKQACAWGRPWLQAHNAGLRHFVPGNSKRSLIWLIGGLDVWQHLDPPLKTGPQKLLWHGASIGCQRFLLARWTARWSLPSMMHFARLWTCCLALLSNAGSVSCANSSVGCKKRWQHHQDPIDQFVEAQPTLRNAPLPCMRFLRYLQRRLFGRSSSEQSHGAICQGNEEFHYFQHRVSDLACW